MDAATPESTPNEAPRETTAPPGRYIPHSGGSAGWYENTGVMASERSNNYHFFQAMDLPDVRSKQFQRWGQAYDRREGPPRARKALPINVLQQGGVLAMYCWDCTARGMRLQFAEPPSLAVNDDVSIELLSAPGGDVLASIDAQAIWSESFNGSRAVWQVGLFFPFVSTEAAATLSKLVRR